jgi:Ulp1 family protease
LKKRYLFYEYRSKYGDDEKKLDKIRKIAGIHVAAPAQTNFYDCGIYLLQYVEYFFTVK